MASKSGGHEVRNRGRRGHKVLKGRALSASHIKSTEKFAEKVAGHSKDGGTNKQRVDPKKCDISFETTSNGGRGGLLKQLQVKKVAEKLALLTDSRPNSSEKFADQNNNVGCIENSLENRDSSITPTSNGGCRGQKDSQPVEKVAEKLALLDEKSAEFNEEHSFKESLEKRENSIP